MLKQKTCDRTMIGGNLRIAYNRTMIGSNLRIAYDGIMMGGDFQIVYDRTLMGGDFRIASLKTNFGISKFHFVVSLIIVFIVFCSITAEAATLRIGLISRFKDIPQITVSATSDFRVSDASDNTVATVSGGEKVILSAKSGSIILARNGGDAGAVGKLVRVTCSSPDAVVLLSSDNCQIAQYHGKIEVKSSDLGLVLTNEVDLEDYLRGVLPSEMPPSFNLEALKAQAVAARTYAWRNRNRHGKQGWDLCDSTDCQVYLGTAGEKPSTSEAIKQTEGLVMVYNGSLISALYCSDCGGKTKNGGEPYLRSVVDRPDDKSPDYCEHEKHSWTKSWTIEEFENILKKNYPDLKCIKSISAVDTDATGRVKDVKIEAKSGGFCIDSIKLRRMLGLTIIRSTVFTVKIEDGNVIFNGKGFGHGVGLCQFGANGLASAPHNYTFDRILKHYYQGVDIVPLDSVR